jgi:hypothetical protein
MTPIKWLIIAWSLQTIMLLYLIFDLHTRMTNMRHYVSALIAYLDLDIEKILEIAEKLRVE